MAARRHHVTLATAARAFLTPRRWFQGPQTDLTFHQVPHEGPLGPLSQARKSAGRSGDASARALRTASTPARRP